MKKLITTILLGMILAAPAAGENKRARFGAGGAAAGAAAGYLLGGNTKSTAIGAALGGAAGALKGHTDMKKQQEEFEQALADTGVSIVEEGDNLRLIMPGNLTFASSSSDINGDFYPVLSSILSILMKYDDTRLTVTGHTDSTGSLEINRRLSVERADSVKDYFVSQGVEDMRIFAHGMDSRVPIATNDTPEGREANRRVEIEITPNTI